MKRIKCLLGFHSWKVLKMHGFPIQRECRNCALIQRKVSGFLTSNTFWITWREGNNERAE